jgi:transcriptional regulator
MEKAIKIINDRLNFLNDWLEKTKNLTDESTVANRISVNDALVYFIRMNELIEVLGQNPTLEIAQEVGELMNVTIDKLIEHNEKALNGHAKLVESLNSKINANPNASEIEKTAISDFEKAYSTIKEYLDACIEARNEVYALIEKATVPYIYDAVDPEDENELEVPAPVKYDIDELVQAIEEHTKENSEPEENTTGIEFTEEDADDKTDTEDVDDKEFPI